jgi:hypothetical protein
MEFNHRSQLLLALSLNVAFSDKSVVESPFGSRPAHAEQFRKRCEPGKTRFGWPAGHFDALAAPRRKLLPKRCVPAHGC